MLQILEFIFQDFWHWLGSVIIIGIIAGSIAGISINRIIKKE